MIEYLRWMTYAVMPLVYDESLSYVELLNKVVAKLNEVIAETNVLSEHIDKIISEWLKTDEAQKAVEDSIGKFIEAYSKTPNFHDVLVEALATQSAEIETAAKEAINTWINSAAGIAAIGDGVDDYMNAYVKSAEFNALVQGFINELDTIRRGNSLSIKQKQAAAIYSPLISLQSSNVTDDYTVTTGNPEVYADLTHAGMRARGTQGIYVNQNGQVVCSGDLYMGEADDSIKKKIHNVDFPKDNADAVNKEYVDLRIKDGSGMYLVRVTYSKVDGKYHSNETFADIAQKFPNVYLVDTESPEYVYFPISNDNANISFIYVSSATAGGAITYTSRKLTYTSDNVWQYNEANISDINFIKADGKTSFKANQSMGGNRLVSVGDPVADTDAANMLFVNRSVGTVLRGACTVLKDNYNFSIGSITGVDYAAVAEAANKNNHILLVLEPDNMENTFFVFHYVGEYAKATSGANRFRHTFITYVSWHDHVISDNGEQPRYKRAIIAIDFEEGDSPTREKDSYVVYHVGSGAWTVNMAADVVNNKLANLRFGSAAVKATFEDSIYYNPNCLLEIGYDQGDYTAYGRTVVKSIDIDDSVIFKTYYYNSGKPVEQYWSYDTGTHVWTELV